MDTEETDFSKSNEYKELGYQPQKPNAYNILLPYGDRLDTESERLLTDLKTNLSKALLSLEMRPGVDLWTLRFTKYLKLYGLKFSKEDHIAFIQLFYQLLITPNLEPARISKCVAIITHLLKKRHLISRDEFQLEWRPLYKLCLHIIEKNHTVGLFRCSPSLDHNLRCMIRLARIYFPASATQEILDEFRPKLCALSVKNIQFAMDYLEIFLPLCVKPEEAAISYQLWFHELMQLWNITHTCGVWEDNMMWLMARLANFTMGSDCIDWEPYVPIMFTRFIRSLNLPVGFRQRQVAKQFKLNAVSMAVWIVSTLNGDRSSTFVHLERLMQTLETYYHSANLGRWTAQLKQFLHKLAYYFVQRLYTERYRKITWETPVPEMYKLSESDVDRFVILMKPCLEQAMFSRQGVQDISSALQYLASIRPNIIVPITLNKLYASMDSLTEPHRLTSSLMAVSAVSRYMVRGRDSLYPEGATHVFPLLMALLPGIDPNDLRKCVLTFNLMVYLINMVPLVNCADASLYYDDLTDEEQIVCASTANAQDFVLQFFDQLCVWVESSSLEFIRLEQLGNSSSSTAKNRMETLADGVIVSVTMSVLHQCSPEIFTATLKKVFNFAIGKVFEIQVSGKMVASLCQGFVQINAKETFKMFIPYLTNRIQVLMDDTANVDEEEHLDAELLYNMQVLCEILDGRSELIHYADDLIKILDRTLHMQSLMGSQMAARMLDIMLSSLTYTLPKEFRSVAISQDTPLKDYLPIRDWGRGERLNNLHIDWYVPGEPEIQLVQRLLQRYLLPQLECLERYINDELTLSRDKLRQTLRNIVAAISCHSVLPMWEESPIPLVESVLDVWACNLIVGEERSVVHMPDGQNVRKCIADVMHRLQQKVLRCDEGDTNSITNIIRIYNVLVLSKSRQQDFDHHWKGFHILKKAMEDRLHQNKLHLRHILINRVLLQHEFRIESRSCAFTETHRRILLDLFELSVSHYSQIRCAAQAKLFAIISMFPYSYTVLTERILATLKMNSCQNHERFKGCLYVLNGPKSSPIVVRHDWRFVRQMWPAIVRSMPSEKPSIIALIGELTETVAKFYPTVALHVTFTPGVLKAADVLQRSRTYSSIGNGREDLDETHCEQRIQDYKDLMEDLLEACIHGNLHWRYREMTLRFLKVMVHTDVKYSMKAVKYFLSGLIDESYKIRKLSLRTLLFTLVQLKPTFIKVPRPLHLTEGTPKTQAPGIRDDNKWLLYNSAMAPTSETSWEDLRYLHDGSIGFYAWPKQLEVYAPPSAQPHIDVRQLSAEEAEILAFFTNPDNVAQLIKYWSMEQKKGEDEFNMYRYYLFKYLFKCFEIRVFDGFLPHLRRLVADKQEAAQRCAAELLSGIVKGTKHWRFENVDHLWTELLPIFETAITNMCSETHPDWGYCLIFMMDARDPNRLHWLLEYLLRTTDLSQDTQTTIYVQCARVHLLYSAVHQQNWRNIELSARLLDVCRPHLAHTYQNVRNKIAASLVMIFTLDLHYPLPDTNAVSIVRFLRDLQPELDALLAYTLNERKHNGAASPPLTATNQAGAIRLFKLVGKFVLSAMKLTHLTLPQYFDVLPLICLYQSNDTDDEIEPICTNFLVTLAQTVTRAEHMPVALERINQVAHCVVWSVRAILADFLTPFIFHNFPVLVNCRDWVVQIEGIALNLLEDSQPEVRIAASKLLSGLFHCKFVLEPNQLLAVFERKAKTELTKTKLSNRSDTKASSTPTTMNGLRFRHAGVLGLCAFISAHPYDVPEELPHVFGQLGAHLNDPQPIPGAIRKTIGDFKRTHHENWQAHKLKFTEEELLVLSDLTVPPSYYA